MIAIQAGDLIYDGAGKHLIHGLTKSSIGESYRFAEGTLDSIEYANYPSTLHKLALRNADVTLRQDIGNYVKNIHHKYQQEIESKGDKKMTDDEVSELIYRETLEDELNKISKVINGEIIL